MNPDPSPRKELNRIIESARRLGVEIDEEEAIQWLTAMAAVQSDEISVDAKHGVYGHKISLLDFTPADLATILYQISALVRTVDEASSGDSEIDPETIIEELQQ